MDATTTKLRVTWHNIDQYGKLRIRRVAQQWTVNAVKCTQQVSIRSAAALSQTQRTDSGNRTPDHKYANRTQRTQRTQHTQNTQRTQHTQPS